MTWQTIIHLQHTFFSELEKTLAEYQGIEALSFLYPSGVHALRLKNQVGEIIMLPFQGQQIWHAEFHGRPLTMKSMFTQPYPTTDYLNTYGAFLVHCGATAMGVPAPDDSHPLHGELPNAPYQSAQLLIGQDERGPYIGVTGNYQHTVAFNHNYVAVPLVKLYANSSRIPLAMTIKNLKQSPMALMYLAHVNFRPVDNGRLVYSAPCTPNHVRVRSSIPSHINPPPGYTDFLQALEANPKKHNLLAPDLAFDPEVVFFIEYQADDNGWAHSMQVHPDDSADFISHSPAQLAHGVRWISRTADQDCLGIVLPATAEPEGFSAEKAKGNLKMIEPGGVWRCNLEVGALLPDEANTMAQRINQILGGGDR